MAKIQVKSKETLDYPKPRKPHSFKEIVKKILKDEEFAEFIHAKVLLAREGDQFAGDSVHDYFWPTPEEMKALKLPADWLKRTNVHSKMCTTTFMLIDFAAPAKIWRKK
jgi:hypothetical protein